MELKEGCIERCPACKHRNFSFEESIRQKERWLKGKLAIWLNQFEPIEYVNEGQRWHYRNKVTLSVDYDEEKWKFGMYNWRLGVIDISACPVQSEAISGLLIFLKQILPDKSVFPLRYVLVNGKQIVLVLKTILMPTTHFFVSDFWTFIKGLGFEGLWLHLNPSTGNRVLEKNRWFQLWGCEFSQTSNGLKYGATAFQQLIPALYDRALTKVLDFFMLEESDIVIDLYSGIGASIYYWDKRVKRILGVELGGEAVKCAHLNFPSVLIYRGKCGERVPQIKQWLNQNIAENTCLFVNPPRTGLELEVLNWLNEQDVVKKIAYLSCSAGTLCRDLQVITKTGLYKVCSITPFDFFPNTLHVETLVLLERD